MTPKLREWTDEKGRTYREQRCNRCGGTGVYPYISMGVHVQGTCFRCGGIGVDPRPARVDAKHLAAKEARRQRAEMKRQEQLRERLASSQRWRAENAALVARLEEVKEDKRAHPILRDLAVRLTLTEQQVELATKLLDERDAELARLAQAQPWEPGRQLVEGVIIASKWKPGFAYYAPDVNKLVVKTDDGRRVYLTAPRPIWVSKNEPHLRDHKVGRCAIGDRIRFTVTIEPSQDDPHFAFGSRPTKGKIVAAGD